MRAANLAAQQFGRGADEGVDRGPIDHLYSRYRGYMVDKADVGLTEPMGR